MSPSGRRKHPPHCRDVQRRNNRDQPEPDKNAGCRSGPRQRNRKRNARSRQRTEHSARFGTSSLRVSGVPIRPCCSASPDLAWSWDRERPIVLKTGNPRFGAHTSALDHARKPLLILRQLRAVSRSMPQVQHASGVSAVLAPHPGMQQPDQQIGILLAPTAEVRVKAIDAVEVCPPDREIARPRTLPGLRPHFSQWTERQTQHRSQPVEPAARPAAGANLPFPSVRARAAGLALRRSMPVSSKARLPVTNQPGSASRRWVATKSGRVRQSPSRNTT